jgi:signal transduction histidine kinase
MPVVSDTAAANYAIAPLDSAVNAERLKDISERAEDISDRLFVACSAAQGELEVLEAYDLADALKDRRNSFADELLEIEIAAHDLDELVDLINKLTSLQTRQRGAAAR